jgi:ABC-type nitrate/sulfonate/bicarbonate transport system permease component
MTEVSIETEMQPLGAQMPVKFRGGGFDPVPRQWVAWVFFAGVLLVWQLGSSRGLIDDLFLPSPLRIARSLYELTASGDIPRHLGVSLMRIGAGWLIGSIFGVMVGGLIGLSWVWRSAGLPFISALFPIPKIALLPLLILWLGIGEASKVATIALGVFFPMAISTYAGVDNVQRNLIRMAQSFNMPVASIVINVVIPGMLPSVLSGCRISASIALILVVSAEMIGANVGIGSFLLTAGNLMQTDQLMAGIVAISILGLLIGALISWLERLLLSWR